MFKFPISRLFLIVAFTLLLSACGQRSASELHLQGMTMGTTYNVKFVPVEGIDADALHSEIEAELARVNRLMSTYDPASELSLLNANDSLEWQPISTDTYQVLREAKRLGELSNGVLDVTVGPLVNLWGFGPQARPENVPQKAEINKVLSRIGLDKFELREVSGQAEIRKQDPALYIDLSTIAKGFGVDQIADIVSSEGIDNFLVEIGGEMRLSGHKASGQDWRVAIEKPTSEGRAVQKILSIGDNAIATSGDYRNYYEREGVRYSHLIDPRTGYPIQHNLVSVTVIHSSSMTADGLATALNVLGKEEALRLAEQNNLAVVLIARENGAFKEYTSAAFEASVTVL